MDVSAHCLIMKGGEHVYLEKIMERIVCYFFELRFLDQRCMSALLLALFMQVALVTTSIYLGYVLTNFYTVAVIVVVCPPAKACCGIANATAVIATAATIAAIAKVVFLWFIFLRGYLPL